MGEIPEGAARALVKGMGAYMRRTPTNELPRSLRALRNFTDKALMGRAGILLKALDDEALRAQIVDWLDEKPSLAKESRRALEVAARREEGWGTALASIGGARPRKPRVEKAGGDRQAEEHKKRAAAAQAELRKVRAEARAEIARARREQADTIKEATSLRADLKRTRAEVDALERKLRTAQARGDREGRRARSLTDSAREKQDSLRTKLKEVKAENAELKKRLTRAARSQKAPSTEAPARQPAIPTRRKRLPVPKGLPEDARETLESWLGRARVTLVIDGYNVTKHEKGFGDIPLDTQRDRLISEAQRLSARFPQASILVVFDGSEVSPGTARRKRGRVKVEYSSPDEIADDHIVARVQELPLHPVVVVTSDRELQKRVAKHGATVASSPQLLSVLRRA